MKKHIILILALSMLSMFGCGEEFTMPYNKFDNKPHDYPVSIIFIRPLSAKVGEEITIMGENFGQSVQETEVTFNDRPAEITYADRNTLKVKVPENLLPSEYRISLFTNGQHVVSEEEFKVIDTRF